MRRRTVAASSSPSQGPPPTAFTPRKHASTQLASPAAPTPRPAAHACVRRSSRRRYFHCHRLVALGPTHMSLFFHFLFFSYPFRPGRTSCSRDCNDFPATSTPPHPHSLPLDPATLTCLRHPQPYQPGYDHHIDPATLPPPRHDLSATSTPSPRHGRHCLDLLRHFHRRRAPRPAPVLSRHSPPPRPHYDAPTSAAHLDPHQHHLDTAPTAASTPAPPTRSPRLNPTPSALHARSPVRQSHIPL
ncbi:hypothetical protein EDB85DRAFT_165223 [Lactarius pseudohatsudake]|nr:hypothetical protein EDB85DRAFT_165223 [Lactarius pseudohatsudake]